MTGSWLRGLLLRFVLLAAVFLAVSVRVPIFVWGEQAALRLATAAFHSAGDPPVIRSLELFEREDDWWYRFEVRSGVRHQLVERRYHPHAYVLLLFACLILATPDLGWRRRLVALGLGGSLVFALGCGLLLSDLEAWERAASDDGLPPMPVFAFPVRWLAGLHRTSGAALVPLLVWVIAIAGSLRPGPAREPGSGAPGSQMARK